MPFSSPGDLPDPGIEPGCPALEADALTSEPPRTLNMPIYNLIIKMVFFWLKNGQSNEQNRKKTLETYITIVRDILDWIANYLEKLNQISYFTVYTQSAQIH